MATTAGVLQPLGTTTGAAARAAAAPNTARAPASAVRGTSALARVPAPVVPKARAPANTTPGASLAAQFRAAEAQADVRAKADQMQIDDLSGYYSNQMRAVNRMAQRQRLVTIHSAQILRRVIPIIGIFSLLAGKADGIQGAVAALAGGLSGLSQGEDKQYQEAWNAFKVKSQTMLNDEKALNSRIKAYQDDQRLTLAQKNALIKSEAQNSAQWANILNRSEATQANIEARHQDTNARIAAQLEVAQMRVRKTQSALDGAAVAFAQPTPAEAQQAVTAAFGKAPKAQNAARWQRQHISSGYSLARLAHALQAQSIDPQTGQPRLTYAQALTSVVSSEHARHPKGINPNNLAVDAASAPEPKATQPAGEPSQGAEQVLAGIIAATGHTQYISKFTAPAVYAAYGDLAQHIAAAGGSPYNIGQMIGRYHGLTGAISELQKQVPILRANMAEVRVVGARALTLARQAGMGRYPSWDALALAAEHQAGSPAQAEYAQQIMDLRNVYARVIGQQANAGATHEEALKEAQDRLAAAQSPEQLAAVLDSLESAGDAAVSARQAELNSLVRATSFGSLVAPPEGASDATDGNVPSASVPAASPGWGEPQVHP